MAGKEYKSYANPMQDGRRKINPELYDEIKYKYARVKSLRKVAKEYGVTKNIISFIVNPRQLERYREYCKGRWRLYKDAEEHKLAMRKYRSKKRKLKIETK